MGVPMSCFLEPGPVFSPNKTRGAKAACGGSFGEPSSHSLCSLLCCDQVRIAWCVRGGRGNNVTHAFVMPRVAARRSLEHQICRQVKFAKLALNRAKLVTKSDARYFEFSPARRHFKADRSGDGGGHRSRLLTGSSSPGHQGRLLHDHASLSGQHRPKCSRRPRSCCCALQQALSVARAMTSSTVATSLAELAFDVLAALSRLLPLAMHALPLALQPWRSSPCPFDCLTTAAAAEASTSASA